MQEIIVTDRFVFFHCNLLNRNVRDFPSAEKAEYLMVTAYHGRPDFRMAWSVHINNDYDLMRYANHHLWDNLDGEYSLTASAILYLNRTFMQFIRDNPYK